MELKELLFIILSSVQALTVLVLVALMWVYKRQLVNIAHASQYQAVATREHADVTMKLVERLDVQTTATTHMALMMSRGVDASLEVAKANMALVNQTKNQAQAMYELADVSTKQASSSAEVANVLRNQVGGTSHTLQPENEVGDNNRRQVTLNTARAQAAAD